MRQDTTSPTPLGDRAQVRRLAAAEDAGIEALLERAFPSTFTRPGDSTVRDWYGVWECGRLVACGADRSRAATGSTSAIAVDPDCRGRGIGAALTATMAREILTGWSPRTSANLVS